MLTLLALLSSMSYPLTILYFETFTLGGKNAPELMPNWVWLFSAAALFVYHTLDAMDGKHARRCKAGSSS